MTALIPRNWRARRAIPARQGRIWVEKMESECPSSRWQVNDDAYAMLLGFRTKAEATDAARFARAYIKEHGDIDLGSFPYGIDDVLEYGDRDDIESWWANDYPPIPTETGT